MDELVSRYIFLWVLPSFIYPRLSDLTSFLHCPGITLLQVKINKYNIIPKRITLAKIYIMHGEDY